MILEVFARKAFSYFPCRFNSLKHTPLEAVQRVLDAVLDFQKKMLGPAGPQVFIFGRQNKSSSRQILYLRTNGIQ